MKTAIQSLKLLKTTIVNNDKLKELMNGGNDISSGVTTRPRLNLTALNKETGMNSYITLSYNKVEGYENLSALYLKVNVVTDANQIDDPATLVLSIIDELNKVITQKDLVFGFSEQFDFGEMEESYFDSEQLTWGYVIIYGISDEPI